MAYYFTKKQQVSILVLMDAPLESEQPEQIAVVDAGSFNPCFNGCAS